MNASHRVYGFNLVGNEGEERGDTRVWTTSRPLSDGGDLDAAKVRNIIDALTAPYPEGGLLRGRPHSVVRECSVLDTGNGIQNLSVEYVPGSNVGAVGTALTNFMKALHQAMAQQAPGMTYEDRSVIIRLRPPDLHASTRVVFPSASPAGAS